MFRQQQPTALPSRTARMRCTPRITPQTAAPAAAQRPAAVSVWESSPYTALSLRVGPAKKALLWGGAAYAMYKLLARPASARN